MSAFNKLSLDAVQEEGFKPLRKTFSEGGNRNNVSAAAPGSFKFKDELADFYKYIDYREEIYVNRLREAVAIKSVSAWPDHRNEVIRMLEWTKDWTEKLGGKVELYENPCKVQQMDDGTTIPLPPIMLGSFGDDPKKKTVCVYGHLDVQPALLTDGWDTEPFELTEIDGKLFGRGSTDDKGPALSWLWMVEAFNELKMDLPVNIKMIYEGMEEYGSEGMFETVNELSKPGKFLANVDFFCISDNYWLGRNKPCLTYGLRGMAYFEVGVECSTKDLHSGVYGGSVHEAMTDLIKLMSTLTETDGTINVAGVMKDVAPVTEKEKESYETIDFDLANYAEEVGVTTIGEKRLRHNTKRDLLMARWRFPTLSLHGIEGAFSDPGAKTVIPRKVMGKFSLRLVPDQDPKQIAACVTKHLNDEFAKLGSPNKMWVKAHHGAKAWLSSTDHPNYTAAASAVEKVYGQKPDMTREGGSIPIATWLEDATQMNVLLLPVGACDDMAHSQNEKFDRKNMVAAIKVLGCYLHEVAKIRGPKPSDCRCEPLTMEDMMIPGAFARGFRCKCEI
ncbi:hypothetical protein TrLO_g10274 [Triparma laevis f. longispina]|uniref:Peptidase M20 dimerisation domain-containing protein n=2 Tax=Triparma laevis TaxID=1534972 RepID=A0A9W7FN47_9STRA|nr:hypothetical protein TrLO_g10274 [Triparma laevis f. longispina]